MQTMTKKENEKIFLKTNVFLKTSFFKNDRYSFSKSSKRVGHFKKRLFFFENETIVFENDRKKKQRTVV